MRRSVTILAWAVLLLLAVHTRSYAWVWTSNVLLFTWAAAVAPAKPRPMNFYGLVLVSQGRWDDAERAFVIAGDARRDLPWDTGWDRTSAQNLRSLAALRRQYGR